MIDLRDLIKTNENVMWEGRPHKAVTILEAIFNPMLVIALIWGGIDFTVIGVATSSMSDAGGVPGDMVKFLLLFFLVHLMPVWIYLGGVLTVFLRWRNVRFMVTTQGLYISGGLLSFNYEMKPWTDIGHINIHQGVFDRMFGVGDVVFICAHNSYQTSHSHGSEHQNMKIYNISDFQQVFKLVNNLQTDVYSDTMYPNAMRPDNNPGYNTQYNRFQ
ncbi:MAG: PH domain-containing protein [Lachnospiraceae bacterium]|nr:PH domain-containing protein [Lachnospiraceae bacterium]